MNQLQVKILDIFKEVKKLCEEENITYFAIGGTCIGAARHSGFIPWDDDLDIAIPIEQYENFIKIAKKKLPSYLEVNTCNDVRHCGHIFIKVVDTRTTYIEQEDINDVNSYSGVFVDIMPLGGFPNNELLKKIHVFKIKLYSYLNYIVRFNDVYEDKELKVVYKIITLFNKKFNYYSNRWYNLVSKLPVSNSKKVGYVWSPGKIPNNIFDVECFKETIELPFEDITISCPIKYDEYLTKQFGDYMKMPKKDEQCTGHEGFVDLNTSYKEYIKKGGIK